MPAERSSVQRPLARKLAQDGDWSAAPASSTEELKVEIHTTEAELSAAETAVENVNGRIRHSFKTGILADVRADRIYDLAGSDAVRLIGEPAQPETLDKPVEGYEDRIDTDSSHDGLPQTEGQEITGADLLQDVDVTGDDVTIAILDSAFDINNEQYSDQLVGTLGSESDFNDGSFSDYYESPGAHGDACTDIVSVMAPEANIVVGTVFDSGFTLMDALDDIEAREGTDFPEVDVVSFSVGYTTTTRIDGNDFRSQRIADFCERSGTRNRTFANSAGNDAPVDTAWLWDEDNQQAVPLDQGGDGPHWDGPFFDANGNGLLEFDAQFSDDLQNSERLPVQLTEDFSGASDTTFIGWINVHWDGDFNTDDQDYEVRLYESPDATTPVQTSRTKEPYESFTVFAGDFSDGSQGDRLYVEIEEMDAFGSEYFDVWAQFGNLTIPSPWATAPRTIGIPSVSRDPDLLAVAAVQAVDLGGDEGETGLAFERYKGDLKGYSSQGPTQYGDRGINYAAPSHVSTNARGPIEDVFGFNGTSAACPHVAGAMGLLYGGSDAGAADLRSAFSATGMPIADDEVSGTDNTKIGDGQINVYEAFYEQETAATFDAQALDQRVGDSEVGVGVTARQGDYVVITTVPGSGDYVGEDVVGFTQLQDDKVDNLVTVDVSGANPVDHAAHIITDLSQDTLDTGTVSSATASNVLDTDTAPIYAVAQFDWQDERYSTATGTVDVDTIEILYNGSSGETEISIDLHATDENGNPTEYIGVSQHDLPVNNVHNDVTIDVVEPVDPDDSNPTRVEDTIDQTDDFFAMAHRGPAGTDDNGDRIPAQKPALLTTAAPGTVGDFATVEVPTARLSTQALDLTAGDSELLVEDVTADAGEYVVITTVPDSGTYEGETVAGYTQVNSDVTETDILIDVSGADPVDHAAHVVSDISQNTLDNGTVSSTTLSNVESTSTPAAIYAVSSFSWRNETFDNARKTVTVDSIEILYQGSVGADTISIDLHEANRDDGTVGAFIGVSQNDLAVNTLHEDVAVDVLEPRGPGDDSPRKEMTLTQTTDAFAMAHLGPAGTDDNGDRIPAQQPALVTTTSPGTIGDFSTVIEGSFDIQSPGSFTVPPRTLVTDQSEDSRLGSSQYSLSMIKTATPGESVEVNVAAPENIEYQVELRDNDLNLAAAGSPAQTGNSTDTFDTSGLSPGVYLFAPIVDQEAMAVLPLIVEGYDAEITTAPSTLETDQVLEVKATITDAVQSPPAIEDVMLFGFTDSDDTGLAVRMDNVSGDTYSASVEGPEADDYQLHVAPRGAENVSFEIQSMTIEEETTSGDTSSLDDAQTDQLISVSGSQPLGLSPGQDLTVELASDQELETVWSQQTGSQAGFQTNVSGQLQFSRPALDSGYLYVGGLDEFVTAHAKNSGELQWTVERLGNLSDSSPTVYNGTLYIGDGNGLLHAINASDGTINWSYDVGAETGGDASAITSTPAVFDTGSDVWVFFGSNDGTFHAVIDNGSSFSQQWAPNHGGGVTSDLETGVLFNAPWVFATTTDGRVLAIDVTGAVTSNAGDLLIDFDAPTSSFGASSPLFDSGNLYVTGDSAWSIDVEATVNQASSLPITNVVTNWEQSAFGGTAGSNPVLDSGVVYVGDADGTVWGLDADTGDPVLSTNSGALADPVSSTPNVVGDRIVVGAPDGLYVLSRYTGDVVGSRDLGAAIRSDPVVMNGNIYVGTEDGEVLNLQNLP